MCFTEAYLLDVVEAVEGEPQLDVMYALCPATRIIPGAASGKRAVHLKLWYGRMCLTAWWWCYGLHSFPAFTMGICTVS